MNLHMTIQENYVIVDNKQCDAFEVLQWVKKNCPHYITNHYHEQKGGNNLIDFCFVYSEQGKKEMAWMILRWS